MSEIKKGLPIGIHELKATNAYYVDKTLLIDEWLGNISKVTLITRPRCFGKTLNMTMLREFFDITKDSSALFEGLAIRDTPYVAEMNQWPVIYLSLRDCKGTKQDNLLGVIDILLQSYDQLPGNMTLAEK